MSLIRLEVHFLLLVSGFKMPACPMKVYDHQAAPGRIMLTNFDDLRLATINWTNEASRWEQNESLLRMQFSTPAANRANRCARMEPIAIKIKRISQHTGSNYDFGVTFFHMHMHWHAFEYHKLKLMIKGSTHVRTSNSNRILDLSLSTCQWINVANCKTAREIHGRREIESQCVLLILVIAIVSRSCKIKYTLHVSTLASGRSWAHIRIGSSCKNSNALRNI
jgi:hypothetical protein